MFRRVSPSLRIGKAYIRLVAAAAALLIPPSPALAIELFDNGETAVRWDNTVRYSAAARLDSADPRLIADPNGDDGDRSFSPGLISNRFDLFSELGFTSGSFGGELSAQAWYDTVYNGHNDNTWPQSFNPVSVPYDSFTKDTRELMGRDAELVNAFLYDHFEIGSMPASLRIGRQTVQWGESLYFAENGIAAGQAPVDATRQTSLPFARASEVYMPVAQAVGSLQPTANLALDFYYQFEWRRDRLPPVGSYFSVADFADAGGERIILGNDQYLSRGADQTPGSGQFGVAARLTLDNVDLGFYALRFNAKDPQLYIHVSGRPAMSTATGEALATTLEQTADYGVPGGTGAGGAFKFNLPPGVYTGTGTIGSYSLVFPENIQLYGISASGYLGSSTVAGEISGRVNMPLVSTPQVVPYGTPADGSAHALYALGDTLHAQVSSVSTLEPTRLWDGADLSVELAANALLATTRNAAARDPTRDDFALAGRAVFQPAYYKVLPGLDVSFPVSIGYGITGNSVVDGSDNVKAGDIEIGAQFLYRAVWEVTVTLTQFIGSPARQPFADRNYLAFSLRRTF